MHKARPFFNDLVHLHDLGPGRVAGTRRPRTPSPGNRDIMGATDPKKADKGTIRKPTSPILIEANSVHGSDSPENAEREIGFFFSEIEITG